MQESHSSAGHSPNPAGELTVISRSIAGGEEEVDVSGVLCLFVCVLKRMFSY